MFTLGKDRQFRPVVYVRLQVIKNKAKFGTPEKLNYDDTDPAIDWLISLIREKCFVPYFVENWIMIVDCDEMGVMSFPVKFLTKLLKLTQLNHASCMHRMFLVNTPGTFNVVWSMIKRTSASHSLHQS